MDAAHEAADDALDAFSERVRAIYSQAYGEAAALLEKHLEGYAEGVEDMRGRVEQGEMTDDEFRRWRTGKALEGSRFQVLCGQMAECVAHADELAREVLRGLPDVYAENVLFAAYSIESQEGRLFTAVSADALQSLLRGDDLLPPLKDATEWARRHVSQAVTQGVLLGESVPRISKRLEDAVGMSRRAAVRTARTAVTSAENAGRKAACDRAASMGARVTRRWMATLDGRTRDSHRALDGERVGEDGKFSNGLRFPGDPTGRPEEFYNCRCTTVPEVRGHDVFGDRWERLPEGTTYEEWKTGIASERGISAKKGAAEGTAVDLEFVRSDDYRRKFDAIDVSPKSRTAIRDACVAALTHRGGTKYEDLALVSLKKEEVVAVSSRSVRELEVVYGKKANAIISDAERGELFAIHNHPTNLPPTGSDFSSAGMRGYAGGVVCLHNGEVFYYRSGNDTFSPRLFDSKVVRRVKMGMSEYDAIIETMRDHEESCGLRWEKL